MLGTATPRVARASALPLRGLVQADRRTDERHEGLLVDLIVLVEVDGPPGVALEARVEQPRGILQRGALEECELDHALVRLTGADRTLVRPHRDAGIGGLPPLPLLDNLGVGLLDQGADPRERGAPPVAQLVDPRVYLLSGGLVVLRGALRHAIDATAVRSAATAGR